MMGPKKNYLFTRPHISKIWFDLGNKNLTNIKIVKFEEVKFHLQAGMVLLP